MEIFTWLKKYCIRKSTPSQAWCPVIVGYQSPHFFILFATVVAWWQLKAADKDSRFLIPLALDEVSGAAQAFCWSSASQVWSSSPTFCCKMRNEHKSAGYIPQATALLNWVSSGCSEIKNSSSFYNETPPTWNSTTTSDSTVVWARFWWMWSCENI